MSDNCNIVGQFILQPVRKSTQRLFRQNDRNYIRRELSFANRFPCLRKHCRREEHLITTVLDRSACWINKIAFHRSNYEIVLSIRKIVLKITQFFQTHYNEISVLDLMRRSQFWWKTSTEFGTQSLNAIVEQKKIFELKHLEMYPN